MQTFLPYPDFGESAKCLDMKRLGKQRVEAWQILLTLRNDSGWRHHPAVLMWKGYEPSLALYGLTICNEWTSRKYRDTLAEKFMQKIDDYGRLGLNPLEHPWWFGWGEFHDSHKSNLIRKLPGHYQPLWPEMNGDLPYIWPSKFENLSTLSMAFKMRKEK